jgi:cytochrome P450
MNNSVLASEALPDGLHWDAARNRLKVRDPALADIMLRDPHLITGVDRSRPDIAKAPARDSAPSVSHFFEMWYTVGDNYAPFNIELRKAFTARTVAAFEPMFVERADQLVTTMPHHGDLARHYLAPYFMTSTFGMLGVPKPEWANLTKVAKLVIHFFKQQLLGVTEHKDRQIQAFETVMRYLKSLTDRLLASDAKTPFLVAARRLSTMDTSTWPIAALIGQLLMAGIEPMIVGSSIACHHIWQDPRLLAAVQERKLDFGQVAEEVLRQSPPFGNIFRFVREPCDCLGLRLHPGAIVAIDVAAVNLTRIPAQELAAGCPVRASDVLTFGMGVHYCLGAHSARIQVAAGIERLVIGKPALRIDDDRVRIDTQNNLKEVGALPYTTVSDPTAECTHSRREETP